MYLLHNKCYYRIRWCGPCKTLGPRLEALAAEKLDKFHLAKVDIDNVPELAEEYNVCSSVHIIIKLYQSKTNLLSIIDYRLLLYLQSLLSREEKLKDHLLEF